MIITSRYRLVTIFIIIVQIQYTLSFFDPFTLTIGAGIGLAAYGYQKLVKCSMYECCNNDYVPMDISSLENNLKNKLYGQKIVERTVVNALYGYKDSSSPPKALAMSFHGSPGSGKNFVARMIAQSFFKKGMNSNFYHFFNGRTYAPVTAYLEDYKIQLRKTITESLMKCERSMFVFDEVDMMPVGLLNVIVPFLDYGYLTTVHLSDREEIVKINKAIFIFLSNTGSKEIMNQMIKFWQAGKNRDDLRIGDFENLIAQGAFNEKGGFHKSDTISSSLIDYYVPFLPLEAEHVKLCMRDAFAEYRPDSRNEAMEKEVMSVVTWGPEPHNIYANSGCKRIEQRVISVRYRQN